MKILRNREVKKEMVLFALASGLFAFLFHDSKVFLLGILFLFISLLFTRRRYQEVADLSADINKILHGKTMNLERYSEGELAILSSEIEKMVLRLQEDASLLTDEKNRLKDALADISHQLRTPLTSLNITLSLLSNEEEYEKRVRYTYDVKKQLERIWWLIEVLLKISKIDADSTIFSKKIIFAKDLLDDVVAPFEVQMELKSQCLVIHCGEERVFCDPYWTNEAFSNILKNAVEHTPEGGQIVVGVEETPIFTEFLVQNKGVVIDEQDIPRLFERFYRGKNSSAENVGIGLSLTQMIVANQGGALKVKNRSEGVEFSIRLYHEPQRLKADEKEKRMYAR